MELIAGETIRPGDVVSIGGDGKLHPALAPKLPVFTAPVDIKEDDIVELSLLDGKVLSVTRAGEVIYRNNL